VKPGIPLYAALHEIGEAIRVGPGDVMVVGYDAINSVLRDPGFRVSDESSLDRDFPGWPENPSRTTTCSATCSR
jgi:hypothetical protein